MPEIPLTATETYLEKITEKIHKRLEETDSERVKKRLYALLKTVEERQQQLQQHTKTSATQTSQESSKAPYKHLEEFELLDNEQKDVEPSQAPLETGDLTDEGDTFVQDPMAEMIAEIQEQQEKSFQHLEVDEETIFELGPDLELILDSKQTVEPVSEREIETSQEQIIELGPEHEIEPGTEQEVIPTSEQATEPVQELQPELSEQTDLELLSFENICQRVGKGESLILFEKIALSEREQQIIEAFNEHLTQMKGLKRQQAFDMQHLTARSIRELEQILKTYHLQGYLRAELNNIYNRLLNLRSRFSILLH